jgi:hypothetical protein
MKGGREKYEVQYTDLNSGKLNARRLIRGVRQFVFERVLVKVYMYALRVFEGCHRPRWRGESMLSSKHREKVGATGIEPDAALQGEASYTNTPIARGPLSDVFIECCCGALHHAMHKPHT